MNATFRWPSVERVLKDRIWSDATASGSVLKFWISGSIELRYSEDKAVVEELANAMGLKEQLAMVRKRSDPDKVLMLEASTELCFTAILVRAGIPFLIQLEASKLFRGEGIRCYRRYVQACCDLLEAKQIAGAAAI